MRVIKWMSIAALSVAVAGCGSDEMSEEDSAKAFSAAMVGATTAWGSVAAAAQSSTTTITFDEDFSCTGGGTMAGNGNIQSSDSSYTFDLDGTYNDCVEQGITMNGTLSLSGSGDDAGSFEMSIDGEVSFTGGVEGTCTFDVTFSVSAGSQLPSYSGTICGHSVSDLAS